MTATDPAVGAINIDLAETITDPSKALRLCADMFLSYEAHHRDRGTAPGVSLGDAQAAAAKAATNSRMAAMCERLIGAESSSLAGPIAPTDQDIRSTALYQALQSFQTPNAYEIPTIKHLLDRASAIFTYITTGVAVVADDPIVKLRDFLDQTEGGQRGEDEDIADAAIRLLSEATRPDWRGAVVKGQAFDPGDLPNYAAMEPGDMLAAVGTDALKWAEAFTQFAVAAGHVIDTEAADDMRGTMLGWFANAIELGRDAGLRQNPSFDPSAPETPDFRAIFAEEFQRADGKLGDDAPILQMIRDGTDSSNGGHAAIRAMERVYALGFARSEYRTLTNMVGTDCLDAPAGGTPLYQLRFEALARIRDRLEAGKWATSAGQPGYEDFDLAIADIDASVAERGGSPPAIAMTDMEVPPAPTFTDAGAEAARVNPGTGIGHAGELREGDMQGQPGAGNSTFTIGQGFGEGEEGLRHPDADPAS